MAVDFWQRESIIQSKCRYQTANLAFIETDYANMPVGLRSAVTSCVAIVRGRGFKDVVGTRGEINREFLEYVAVVIKRIEKDYWKGHFSVDDMDHITAGRFGQQIAEYIIIPVLQDLDAGKIETELGMAQETIQGWRTTQILADATIS